jgi:hypothetical protein
MDTFAGNNEDPLSLHKYLYCQDNPVMGSDPSGHEDIGSVLTSLSIISFANTWDRVTPPKSVKGFGAGPDVTIPLKTTLDDVDLKISKASPWTLGWIGQVGMFDPIEICGGWDITPLYTLGRGMAAGQLGGTDGYGPGFRTVQYSHQSGPLKVYWAGAVNYVLWGHMFGVYHSAFPSDQKYSLSTAIGLARSYKFVASFRFGSSPTEENSAMAFIKLGYDGTDPSSVALPLASDTKNVARPGILEWQFLSLHAD